MHSYTYMGTADDVVRRYPWKHGWNIESINHQLIHSIIYGQKLVINDGYLVTNPEFLESFKNLKTSLLGNALLSGSAIVFCRADPRNLAEGLHASKEKILTHRQALNGKDGRSLTRQMETLQKFVNKEPIQWPKDKNTGAIFASFLATLNNNSALDLALPLPGLKDDFLLVFKNFEQDMDENFNEARQHWERLCWQLLGNLEIDKRDLFDPQLQKNKNFNRIKSLMHVANEAYHVAYTSALHWSLNSLGSINPKSIRPLTAFCPAYLDLFEREFILPDQDIRFDGLGSLLISVDLLKFGEKGDFSWVMSLVLDDEIVEIRQEYLSLLDKYMHRDCEHKEALKIARNYRAKLAQLVADEVPSYSDIAETLFNFFGGSQVISGLQAVDTLLGHVNIATPVNLDPVKSVKKIIESPEIQQKLEQQGMESIWYGTTNKFARDLGLINTCLDETSIEKILKPIKPYNPNA